MTNNERNAIPQGSSFRRALRLTGAFLTLCLVGGVLAAWFVNRYVVFAVEHGRGRPSVLVHTPLGSFPSGLSKANPSTLWAAVYPKSEWDEENYTDFYHGAAGNEEKTAQLTVLRFRIKLSLVQVDEWYRQRLGESFTRSKGWFLKTNEQGRGEWLRSVSSDTDPEAIVYGQQMPGRVRGVLLETPPDASGVLATLYDFQEGKR
jgi:hypothetical protein